MVTAENVPCGAEAVSCTKSIKFTIHDTGLSLYFGFTRKNSQITLCKRKMLCLLNLENLYM